MTNIRRESCEGWMIVLFKVMSFTLHKLTEYVNLFLKNVSF